MAGIKDPAFWRRFSVAVHLDEEVKSSDKEAGSYVFTSLIFRARRKARKMTIALTTAN
jgi:hypothetical protein